MASLLFRLGRFSFRHKWWVIAGWLLAAVAVVGLVGALSPKFSKDFELPGTDGGTATEQIQEYFPEVMKAQERASTSVLVYAEDGLAGHRGQVDALIADLQKLPNVAAPIVNPLVQSVDQASGAPLTGDNGKVGLIQVRQTTEVMDLTVDDKDKLVSLLDKYRGSGLQVEATGSLMQVSEQGGTAELIGFAVAFVVMIVAFGAIVAAFIPLITGIVGVIITIMLLTLGASFLSINESATAIVTMLGIAVSIDYALFIVSRYRAERNRGGSAEDAAGRAVGTAGTAVVFAGLTVIIAVVALMVVGIPFITQMGAGAGIAVFIAVLAALTLIPALLGATGRFAFSPKIPWIKHAEESATVDTNGVKFGRLVVRRPIPFIIAGLAILVVAALPMGKMELGMSMSSPDEARATTLLQKGFGEGVNGQLFVVVHADEGTVNAAADDAVERIKALPGIANPDTVVWMGNGTQSPNVGANTALITVTPLTGPSDQATHDLMDKIRAITPQIEKRGAEMHVGGQTAILSDLSAKLDEALIPYLIVVVGLAFLIMIGVFRSLWVPLIGTLGFIFSVLATFGVTVAIFQEGDFGLIENTQPILSFLPIFLIGVVFGLAMDYQVFLVTRMREEYIHGMSAKDAIIAGYRHGARVVTSAAVIMISVFAAFMLSPDVTGKMLGFAMACAIVFDAFIIRMTVVPAVIALLGDRAWGLPKWLDRVVLNFDIEGGAVRNRGIPQGNDESDGRDVTSSVAGVQS
ncbi:MMPL family transporter [Gordonia sp. ABSL1-1]|uniref:MMPL family transporter n=1 Tax=Gordonia sp. ABSL1-1 TaxID=3053923 RepID=UPI0025741A68|nr:MMPL family transporter [Gordonia sp. ABSL1-1]MDL9937831.1 MMPL family transporter [Gordonia sp. ABSL1-1]